jgi:Ca-activated chloride channel family protein
MIALLFLVEVAFANGTLDVRGDSARSVSLFAHRVHAEVNDHVAQVTVEQVFRSRSDRRLEGIYRFPLPEGATVSDFAMTMAGKLVKGEVVGRKKAQRIYESIVSRKRDPGLLEKVDRGVFRARVFPIEPGQDLMIRLSFQQVLPESGGTVELRYPLAKERMSARSVENVSIHVTVESSADLKTIYCPSHRVKIRREGARNAVVSYENSGTAQKRDFLLYMGRSPEAVGFSLLSHRPAAERGTFLAILAPAARVEKGAVLPKDVLYVLDTSGSMQGRKLAQAQAALAFGIRNLREKDRFNVISFSSGVQRFRDRLVDVGTDTIESAVAWVEGLEANGGTAIDEALQAALSMGQKDRLTIVVFLTDGLPTVGEARPENIVANVKRANTGAARVFVFGVGFDQNVKFLDRIAAMTRASREYITPEQDIEVVVSRFFRRIDQPVLTDLKLELGPGVEDAFPRSLPDLFAGDQLVVMGRYTSAGPRAIRLRGRLQGEEVTYDYEGALSAKEGVACLPRLWAERKVGFLLEQIRLNGRSAELTSEIRRLGTKYSIVTPHTAGLVVEEGIELPDPQPTVRRGSAGGIGQPPEDELSEEPIELEESDFGFSGGGRAGGPSANAAIGLGRGAGGRRNLRSGGSSGRTEDAVELGLKWLAEHQDEEGSFGSTGDSGLALLTFLGAGYSDRGSRIENKYAREVREGLRYLMTMQDDEGGFGPRSNPEFLKGHAIATAALCEAYWMTRNPRHKKPAQEGLDFLARARNPQLAWGEEVRGGSNDTVLTAWSVFAMRTGRFAGLEMDSDALEGARQWLRQAPLKTEREAAAAMVTRILLGEDPRGSPAVVALADRCLKFPPAWGVQVDFEYWHFATLGMFQVGGIHWKTWNNAMTKAIVESQKGDGSWGESVRANALLAGCLEVYFRYERYLYIWR